MECNIVKDLLPLYVKNECCDESNKFIENHLENCQDCIKYVEEVKNNIEVTHKGNQDIKKNKSVLKKVCIILLIIALGYIGHSYLTTVNVTNEDAIVKYIKKYNNIDAKKRNVKIRKSEKSGRFYAVVYTVNSDTRLMIFKQNIVLRTRYRLFGGGSGSAKFNVYNTESFQSALKIVYGNNTKIMADSYSVENGTITYSENINNMDYVLRIYQIPHTKVTGDNLLLFDNNGEKITGWQR